MEDSKQQALLYAVYFTIVLTLLIALIRLLREDGAKFSTLFSVRVLLYVLILLVGNVATTLIAVKLTEKYFMNDSGPAWFWISFLGVFGFEAIIKNINISIFKTGVLTINDWIERAQELAVKSIAQSGQIQDNETEVIIAKPDSDFRYKILSIEMIVDIERPETAKIVEVQELKCCVDRLNDVATRIVCDGSVKNFTDSSGQVTQLKDKLFRTVFSQKNKGDVFKRELKYELENSFINQHDESWAIHFESPTKKYSLTIFLPNSKTLTSFKFYRILHLTHESDRTKEVAEHNEKGRPKLQVIMNRLCYKENFLLSWKWNSNRQSDEPIGLIDAIKQ